MRKGFWRWIAAGVALCLLFSAAGCRRDRPPAPADAVLLAMADTLGTGHTGKIYTRASNPEGGEFLSETLFSALFGEAARGLLRGTENAPPAINDAALYLSVSPTPVELAVFRCSDMRGTATAEGLARTRLDSLRNAWRDTDWADMTESGTVIVSGNYVLLILAPNPDRAEAAAGRVIRRGGSTP